MARTFANWGFPTYPPGATDIWLVRHGESEAHVEGTSQPMHDGHGDPPLSELGHEQARRLAERLAPLGVDAIVTSDLTRARQTAAPLADLLGITPTIEPGLREVHLGEWEGGRYRQMAAEGHPAWDEHLRTGRWDPIPGAEADEALRERVIDALRRVGEAHAGRRLMVVAHAGVIGAILSEITDTPRSMLVAVDQTSVSRLVLLPLPDQPTRFVIRTVNDTAHLGDPLARPLLSPPR